MNDLCNELLIMVIDHVLYEPPSENPAPARRPRPRPRVCYAAVSRQWQAIVEERSGSMASIRLKSSQLYRFSVVYQSQRRRALLKDLHYTIDLPNHSRLRSQWAANCAAFEAAIVDLFHLLGSWEKQQQQQQQQQNKEYIGPLNLHLITLGEAEERYAAGPFHLPDSKSAYSRRYLGLSRPLPVLHSIAALTIKGPGSAFGDGRAVHPTAACDIAAAAPRLCSLSLRLHDLPNRYVDTCRQHRAALATGLLSTLRGASPPVRLVLQRETVTLSDCHDYEVPDLRQDGVDALCEALKLLGREGSLAELELDDVLVSEALFQGSEGDTWPALRRFSVRTEPCAANGRWWYTGGRHAVEPPPRRFVEPDGDVDDRRRDSEVNGESPVHRWRVRPDPATFNPLMEAVAGAVLRMPALEFGRVQVGFGLELIDTVVQWASAGFDLVDPPDLEGLRARETEDLAARRCGVWVPREEDAENSRWDVPESVMELWREWVGGDGIVDVMLYDQY